MPNNPAASSPPSGEKAITKKALRVGARIRFHHPRHFDDVCEGTVVSYSSQFARVYFIDGTNHAVPLADILEILT